MPALAGCSPCGETWTGVGFTVTPDAVTGSAPWGVDAQLTVEFSFGRDGYGLVSPALALFDAEGAVLATAPLDDLRWEDVPAERRETTDCGDHATVTRAATLETDAFPRWVGLRYDRFRTGYDDPTRVSRYAGADRESARAADYESVDLASAGPDEPTVDPGDPVTDIRFRPGPLRCDVPEPSAEATTNVMVRVEGDRSVPAAHYHPVLESASLEDDELVLSVGLRTAPRFRRGECLRIPWSATVDVERPADVPATVLVRALDADGEVTGTRRLEVETDPE